MTAGPWIGLRRKLLKKAKRRHRKKRMEWINGRLCFSSTKKPVPRVRQVSKPNRQTIGRSALQQ